MADRPMPLPAAPEPVADDVTPPESGDVGAGGWLREPGSLSSKNADRRGMRTAHATRCGANLIMSDFFEGNG